MRAKRLKNLILMAALLSCAVLSACGGNNVTRPFDFRVTFNYNVEWIGETDCPDQYLGVMNNSLVGLQPDNSESFRFREVIGYYNEGWYLPQTDADGVPLKEDGRVLLDRKWDFATERVTGDVTLYGNFIAKSKLTIKVEGGTDTVYSGQPGETASAPSATMQPKKAGWTFLGYYEDENFQTPFVWPYTYTAEDKTIHTRFIEGVWTIVTDAAGFNRALTSNPNGRIYIDTDVLDFSQTQWLAGREFNGEIDGNGCTFINVNVNFKADKNTQSHFGMFGILKSGANIHDLTVDGAEAVFSDTHVSVEYKAALFAWRIESGAKLENVTVSGNINKGTVSAGSVIELYGFCADDRGALLTNCDFSQITTD